MATIFTTAGAVLSLLARKQVVDLAGEADTESALEEHQCQAGGADDEVD